MLMKGIITLVLTLFVLTLNAQDNIHVFKTSKLNVNLKGEKIETSTAEPTVITIDLAGETIRRIHFRSFLHEYANDHLHKK